MKVIDRAVQKEKLAAVLYSDDPRADFMKQLAADGQSFSESELAAYLEQRERTT